MALDTTTDILMQLVASTGPIKGGSTAALSKSTLLSDFKPGCYFEIEALDLGLTRPAPSSSAVTAQGAATDLSPISVTRRIDQASLSVLDACFCAKPFTSAAVVKRRSAGTGVAGEPYLRIDFTGVLVTEVSWGDGEIVNESFKFICRAMTFTYLAQSPSGDLLGNFSATWTQVASGATS